MHKVAVSVIVAFCKAPEDGVETVPGNPLLTYPCGGEYSYQCEEGYRTNDPLDAVCLVNLSWSIPPPKCEGK